MSQIITRFAPSPTGFLHLGGARTALFNWLFAKNNNGKFLLRIEDTDQKRSTDEAVNAIFSGLNWLGIKWDETVYRQFERRQRHIEVAEKLVAAGKAYRCYSSPEELDEMRKFARISGSTRLYDGTWRDKDPSKAPHGVDPVIRIKIPTNEKTIINDLVQGQISVSNDTIDDMIILRSDGSPTYMLAVVVDDYDMNISHVIRGDDHLTNAFRQMQIYYALNWKPPLFAHIPLLHGSDGQKLSKRHGAIGIQAYKELGILPKAMNNYLLRLGWSHGNQEIISEEEAIKWFNLEKIGKAAAKFDIDKLLNINSHYIKSAENDQLIELILPELKLLLESNLSPQTENRLKKGLEKLKNRVKTIPDLIDNCKVYAIDGRKYIKENADKSIGTGDKAILTHLEKDLSHLDIWGIDELSRVTEKLASGMDFSAGKIAQPLRSVLCGKLPAPGIYEVMYVLGKNETLNRLNDIL